jgi:hypothetical protein
MQLKKLPEIKPNEFRDLQFEVLCTQLISNGLSYDDLQINCLGSFRKSYHGDLEKVSVTYTDKQYKQELKVSLNRNGIYDRLPEGIFHQPLGNKKVRSVQEMKDEHQRYKEEESYARRFFQPVEHEILRYAVLVEQNEQAIFGNLNKGNLHDDWRNFWGVSSAISREYAAPLIRLMPWRFFITGNPQLTLQALKYILGEEITLEQVWKSTPEFEGTPFSLGSVSLGENTIPGGKGSSSALFWHFYIHNLTPEKAEKMPPTQPLGQLIKRFADIFIPIHIYHTFEPILLDKDFVLEKAILGYGTRF